VISRMNVIRKPLPCAAIS